MCVFSKMKHIKHIRRDLNSVAWAMPKGWDLGYLGGGGVGVQFFPRNSTSWCVSYLHEGHMQRHNCLGPRPHGFWGGARRSNILKSQTQSQFQRCLTKFCVCLLINERYKAYQTGFLLGRLGQAPGLDLGVPWGLGSILYSEFQPDFVWEILT